MENRRILVVVNAFENDAPTLLTLATLLHLKERGWTTAMVAWSRGGVMEETLAANNVPFEVLTQFKSPRAARLCGWIQRFRPAIVQSVLARPTLGVFATRLICSGPHGFRWLASDYGVHEWLERGPVIGSIMNRLMPSILTAVDKIHAVSEAAATDLRVHGLSPDLITIVPNGVNTNRFYPRSKSEQCSLISRHFTQDTPAEVWPLIGAAGNLRIIKGFEDLVAAVPLVLAKWPRARFIIWGTGPEQESLAQQVRALGVSYAVAFAGFEKGIERRLPLLDLYVQPSRRESFGMAAAEAMLCGVPTVVSSAGGLPGLASGGVTARVFQKQNPQSLAHSIDQLLSDKKAMQKMGEAGREFVLDNFSEKQLFRRLLRLYEELLEQPL